MKCKQCESDNWILKTREPHDWAKQGKTFVACGDCGEV